jgi:DNA primase
VPYFTAAGAVDIKLRCTSTHDCKTVDCPKYLPAIAGNGQHLYNAQVLIQTSDLAVITEGELDAVCVQHYCAVAAVAFPGTESWNANRHWRYCFEGIGEVLVIADGDEVGHKAATKVAESIGMSARVIDMPAKYDSNSYIQEKGANAFLELIKR